MNDTVKRLSEPDVERLVSEGRFRADLDSLDEPDFRSAFLKLADAYEALREQADRLRTSRPESCYRFARRLEKELRADEAESDGAGFLPGTADWFQDRLTTWREERVCAERSLREIEERRVRWLREALEHLCAMCVETGAAENPRVSWAVSAARRTLAHTEPEQREGDEA